MRYRQCSLFLALILIINSFCVNPLAEDIMPYEVQALHQIGFLKGPASGINNDYLGSSVKRWQAAIMLVRLTGKEKEAEAFTGTDNFSDAHLVDSKTAIYLAFLHNRPELGMSGVGSNKFNPNANITAKDYYKIMLYALGYRSTNIGNRIYDFAYEDTLSFAKNKGLSKASSADPFTVKDMAIATMEALKANTMDGKVLAYKLVEDGVIRPEGVLPVYNETTVK